MGGSGSSVVEFRSKTSPGVASERAGIPDVLEGKDLEVIGVGSWEEGGERERGEVWIVRGGVKVLVIFGATTDRKVGRS